MDKTTLAQLNRGQRLQEILKQAQYRPLDLGHQVVVLYAGTNGLADEIPIDRMGEWQAALLQTMEASHADILLAIDERKELEADIEDKLRQAIVTFNRGWED